MHRIQFRVPVPSIALQVSSCDVDRLWIEDRNGVIVCIIACPVVPQQRSESCHKLPPPTPMGGNQYAMADRCVVKVGQPDGHVHCPRPCTGICNRGVPDARNHTGATPPAPAQPIAPDDATHNDGGVSECAKQSKPPDKTRRERCISINRSFVVWCG